MPTLPVLNVHLSPLSHAVLLASIIYAIQAIFLHYRFFAEISREESWTGLLRNYTDTNIVNNSAIYAAVISGTFDISAAASAERAKGLALTSEKRFWTGALPYHSFLYFTAFVTSYYWNVWLERMLPSRPRARDEKAKKRTSLKKRNVLAKWLLDITIGKLAYEIVFHVVEGVVALQSPAAILEALPDNIGDCFATFLFGFQPLGSLVGMMLVPASMRVVSMAACELATVVAMDFMFTYLVPWLHTEEFFTFGVEMIMEQRWIEARFLERQLLHDEL